MPIRVRPNPTECVRARVLAGYSVPQAAARLEKTATHLKNIENGRSGASPAVLKAMADLYGVPMERLVTFEADGDAA